MRIGQIELTRDQFPSYTDFSSNPSHIFQHKQERLARLLGAQNLMGMQAQQPQQQPQGAPQQ